MSSFLSRGRIRKAIARRIYLQQNRGPDGIVESTWCDYSAVCARGCGVVQKEDAGPASKKLMVSRDTCLVQYLVSTYCVLGVTILGTEDTVDGTKQGLGPQRLCSSGGRHANKEIL